MAVGALVAHHADGADVGEHGERLPDLALQPGQRAISSRTIASASCRIATCSGVTSPMIRTPSPGPGNGWRHTISSGRPSSRPSRRTSSLNRSRSGSMSCQRHVVGQAADVVMALDHGGLAVGAAALDQVGVERALHEELGLGETAGVLLEDADEQLADHLALRLRLGDAGEPLEVALAGVDVDQLDAHVAPERLDDLLALVLAHQPGVDVDARELVTDRAVHERRRDRRVDAAATARRSPGPRRPGPGSRATCSSITESIVQLPERSRARRSRNVAAPPCRAGVCTTSGWNCTPQIRRSSCSSTATGASAVLAVTPKPWRGLGDRVEVAHPHVVLVGRRRRAADEGRRCASSWARPYSPRIPRPTVPPSCWAMQLRAVADAEDRDAEVVDRRIEAAARPRRARSSGRRDRMIAGGASAAISAAVMRWGTISE